ncbi:tubulin epsilon and delta complex protein 1 [Lemur catta]|uniref:tubulin epsilon and delta complex protein 1 n=1 Tax=Lemur catta TaxID=9447 RepID=UPI001E2669CE|nr:tubulin epsilon and delta complex protein 1 [Lemur catta]
MGRRRRLLVDAAAEAGAGALPKVIAALSRSLPAGPSPEIFRRAKFDRPEAAPALWQLLFRLLSPRSVGGASAPLGLEAQACLVKSALRSQGYPRQVLAQLPEDGSWGSRELLLALSWLLARGPVLERLLAQAHVQLGDEMPVCECEAVASTGPLAPHMDAEGPVDIRCVQWLMGRLWFRWRCLTASQQEQCALLSKIHLYTRGCHSDQRLGHLSVAETEMLRDPEGGRQLLRRLERENAGLEAALQWRRGELVFWRWMDTVLGACPPEAPAAAAQPAFLPRIPERGPGQGELVARELRALQEELCEATERRRAAWEARVGGQGRGPQWSSARQALQKAVDQELAALQWAWEQDRGPARPHGPHRLVRREDEAPGGQDLRAAEVIRVLRSQEARLEAALRQLQGQCRQELARLAGALPGLIWILPPGR